MPASKIFLYSCVVLCFGVMAASFFAVSAAAVPPYWAAVFCLIGFSALAKRRSLAYAAVLMAFFALGFWRFEVYWSAMQKDAARFPIRETVKLDATVVSEVEAGEYQKIIVKSEQWPGLVQVTASRYPEYRYGDRLELSGVLEEPPVFEGFDYKMYLAKNGIYAVMKNPAIEHLDANKGDRFYAFLLSAKAALRESVNIALPYPDNALMSGILFGDQNGLPQCSPKEIEAAKERGETCFKLKEEFNISGLRHLTAVSGMHIAIMVPILVGFGLAVGLWRRQAMLLAVVIIWVFIAMIGSPASAVRAGVMGTLLMAGQAASRPAKGGRLVILAATLMVLANPLLLRFDIGFQLSFLAVMGMVYLAPVMLGALAFVPDRAGEVKNILAQTLAAQVFTLPILAFNFGYVSLYALPANALVVPLAAPLTILGFTAAAAGLVSSWLALVLFWPAWLLLEYVMFAAGFFAGLPYAALNFSVPWFVLALSYIVLFVFIVRFQASGRYRFLGS